MFNEIDDKLHEECGVFGIYDQSKKITKETSYISYYGLYSLQHRGQESAGIAISDGKEINSYKNMGLVDSVFSTETLDSLKGFSSIGHVRYSTSGDSFSNNAQPLVGNSKLGQIAIAHNGNLINNKVLKSLLEDSGTVFQTTSDSEVILSLIARGANKGIEKAVFEAIQAIKGSYAIVLLFQDKLIAVRDPNGIRPLCFGKKDDAYVFSSESCSLDAVGADLIRDVKPGEMIICDKEGIHSVEITEKTKCQICAFEYIYFARPDSYIDNISVYESRLRAGEILYKEFPVEADMVIGVPDSGVPAALGFAQKSGIPFELGLIKNKYIGRTFIAPTQELREKAVSVKLNALKHKVKGKRVVLIDDSIVRGTTGRRLVKLMRDAGATEVHFRVASPIVSFPCYFGIDTPKRSELLGSEVKMDDIKGKLGADSLGYLSKDGLLESLKNKDNHGFCIGCFSGIYPMSAQFNEEEKSIPKKSIDINS